MLYKIFEQISQFIKNLIIDLYKYNGFNYIIDYFKIIIIKLFVDVGIELDGLFYFWFGFYIYDYDKYILVKAESIILAQKVIL